LEPRGGDFHQARQWLQESNGPPLRSCDALHLALVKRQNLMIASADRDLARAADALKIPCHWIQ
jgi:predicted nucleic acid-binding protein